MALCAFLHPRFRWWNVMSCFFAGLLLFCHHNVLVNREDLIGRWSSREQGLKSIAMSNDEMFRLQVSRVDRSDATVYRAGWYEELPPWKNARWAKGASTWGPERPELIPFWHSSLTGIFGLKKIPQGYWYPGGRLADGLDKVELRDRG